MTSNEEAAASEFDLRASSDELLLVGEQLLALEQQKRELDVATDDFLVLTEVIHEHAAWVQDVAARERGLAEQLRARRSQLAGRTVAEFPTVGTLEEVLALWRAADRRASEGVDARGGAADAIKLREEYRRRYESIVRRHRSAE